MNFKDLNLPEAVVGWIYNYASESYKRLPPNWIAVDDLIHDGLVAAFKCQQRYGTELDPPHFMRLVQVTFRNHITDLLRITLGFNDSANIMDVKNNRERTETDILDRVAEPADSLQELALLISEMPIHLRDAVELLISDPKAFRRALRVKFDGTGETLSKRLAKLIDWPEHLDFETELRSYLWRRQYGLLTWEGSAVKARIDRVKK